MADNTLGEAGVDRRTNLKLRVVFDSVYTQIEPFFDKSNSWGGHSLEHLAFRVVRENHPELTQEEVHQVVTAAARVYAGKRSA